MLVHSFVTLLSVVGGVRAYTPSGPQILLEAALASGGSVYVQTTAAETDYTFTTRAADATVFTVDTATGFLYQATTDLARFPSGYAVPAVTSQGLLATSILQAYDGNAIQILNGNGYYPLSCSSNLNLGLLQLTVPLVCLNQGLTNLYYSYGICANAGNLVETFGLLGTVSFLLECGTGSSIITNFNAVLYIPPVTTPTNPVQSVSVVTPTGPCSVTVSVIVTTTTSFVPAGYTGPLTTGIGGSTTGPNPYGCVPITSLLHV